MESLLYGGGRGRLGSVLSLKMPDPDIEKRSHMRSAFLFPGVRPDRQAGPGTIPWKPSLSGSKPVNTASLPGWPGYLPILLTIPFPKDMIYAKLPDGRSKQTAFRSRPHDQVPEDNPVERRTT